MIHSVRLFAYLKEMVGKENIVLDLKKGARAKDALEAFGEIYPAIKPKLTKVQVAANHKYLRQEEEIPEQANLAFFPPVSGG